jgi:hypothetical protein
MEVEVTRPRNVHCVYEVGLRELLGQFLRETARVAFLRDTHYWEGEVAVLWVRRALDVPRRNAVTDQIRQDICYVFFGKLHSHR